MHVQPQKAPIRKPRFRTKFAVQKNRRIARVLHSRFAMFDGRITLVSNKLSFKQLREQLLQMENLDRCDYEKFLRRFGVDGELTLRIIQQISTSIDRWSRALDGCNRKASVSKDRNKQLLEIGRLKQRLSFAAQTLRDSSKKKSSLLLDPIQQAEFQQVLATIGRAHLPKKLCARTAQVARLVYWLGGLASLRRFVGTMLVTNEPTSRILDQIDPLSNWLRTLQRREPHEEHWVIGYELRQNSALNDLVEFASLKKVWKKVKKCPLSERLNRYQANLVYLREWATRKADVEFPGTVAAWAVATENGDELPRRVAQQLRDSNTSEKFVARVEYLVDASDAAGYTQVVELLNSNDVCLSNLLIEKVGQWLHDGVSSDDVLFCIKNLKLVAIGDDVSPSVVRRSAERFLRLFGRSGLDWFMELHGHIYSDQQVQVIDTVFRWMEKFSNFKLRPKMNDTIIPAVDNLKKLIELKGKSSDIGAQVSAWYGKANAIAECFPDEPTYPKQLRIWLRRLGYYQRLCDQECVVPKSLRQSLSTDQKRQKEWSYLKSLVDSGEAPTKVRQRFDYLSNLEVDVSKNERKNIREVQEACLLAGLGALRHMMIQESAKIWMRTSRQALHPDWSDNRVVEVGQWASRMGPAEQKFLRMILESHAKNGAEYKSHLPFNQAWVHAMTQKGFAIDHWMFPERKLTKIGAREVVISVSSDPYEVFMMGNYFGSCLSQGGCNEMAVLTNAADANKQVVYVHDRNGTVLARQLIAINRENELLHYCLYVATKEISGENCKLLYRDKVDQFCKEIANRVGLKLGNSGAPTSLANQFWYDDLAEAWEEKKEERKRSAVTMTVALPAVDQNYFFVQSCWLQPMRFVSSLIVSSMGSSLITE